MRLVPCGIGKQSVLIIVALLAAAGLFGACSGDDAETGNGSPTAASPSAEARFSGVVVTTDLSTGPNRYAVGVIDEEEGLPLLNAEVSLKFFKVLGGDQAQMKFESETTFVGFETFTINEETGEKAVSGETGVYVTNVEFDEAGDWGVEIDGTGDGESIGPLRLAFQVLPPEQVLNVGDPAPKARQKIADDVADISEIESMFPPDLMHDVTIADAVASGRPSVILLGTPAFCETQTCGPVMQSVMLPLYEKYNDRATFIHVEPYLLEELRNGIGICAVPAFNAEFARQGLGEGGECPKASEEEIAAVGESWNLTTEPIIFVVDSQGTIAGKFEGIAGLEEVEGVLTGVLG